MQLHKKTKIVATIGPSSEDKEVLNDMAQTGLDVIRVNFSHGDFAEHSKKIDRWKNIAKREGRSLGVIQDLAGPEIRTGDFKKGFELEEDDSVVLGCSKVSKNKKDISLDYPLCGEVVEGDLIFIDDGRIELKVKSVESSKIECEVVTGGFVSSKRGVNVPGVELDLPSLTEKDKKDLEFAVKNEVDFIALSFVRQAKDVKKLRNLLDEKDIEAGVISKIETQQAVENMDEIIELSDGIMVARGDLAIEIGPENVPSIQKTLIEKSNKKGKPVIVATQMLESMVEEPVPTRAEVSDVANAILDGADAVMLSGETASGENPVEVVRVMSEIAQNMEESVSSTFARKAQESNRGVVDSVTSSVVDTANEIGADLIVALTISGFTARMISRFKPDPPIVALSPNQKTSNQLSLSFGCLPFEVDTFNSFDDIFRSVREVCFEKELAEEGDKVVITAGVPVYNEGSRNDTNMMLVEEM
ncbi:MAG: pyruvate kinase [Candidatus Magasanikbacteria bacterium]